MAYAWHPWAGQLVRVHEVIERATGAWARCSPVGADIVRQQEIPAWMLDASVCRAMWRAPEPVAAVSALVALRALLSGAMEECGSGPARGSHSIGHSLSRRSPCTATVTGLRCRSVNPISSRSPSRWLQSRRRDGATLPDQARHAVTALMTRLLIAHAGGPVPEPGSDAR